MIDGDIGPDVAHLLLARVPDFLDVVEVLLDRGSVGKGFDDLHDRGIRVGREEGKPIVLFFDDHYANHTAHGLVGGQKDFVGLGGRFSVGRTLGGLPALPVSLAFGEADAVLPVGGGTAWSASLAASQRTRQVAQRGVLAESADVRPFHLGPVPLGGGVVDHHQQQQQQPSVAGVQPGRQPVAPLRSFARTLPICLRHRWLSHHVHPG